VAQSVRRPSSDELLRLAIGAGPWWTNTPVVHNPWTKLIGFSVKK
jgi:hypothetical protein